MKFFNFEPPKSSFFKLGNRTADMVRNVAISSIGRPSHQKTAIQRLGGYSLKYIEGTNHYENIGLK